MLLFSQIFQGKNLASNAYIPNKVLILTVIVLTRIIKKSVSNKNERRCREVKTQKECKQGWEANIGPKITSI